MRTEKGETVQYHLPIGGELLHMNPFVGNSLELRFTGRIFCIACNTPTRTSFAQGYCFRCMQSLAECDMCIMKPETCHYHLGTCREPKWGEAHCMIEHTVYLANSSGIKVGITRSHTTLTRWMDQGAVQAIPIARVKARRDSGLVEMAMKNFVADKTNWRKMLQGEGDALDLRAKRDELFSTWNQALPGEKVPDGELHSFRYPVLKYPVKIASLNPEKTPSVSGTLIGIKGQYLIFDTGVINLRKFAGYEVEIPQV